jgi:hypothetical protein
MGELWLKLRGWIKKSWIEFPAAVLLCKKVSRKGSEAEKDESGQRVFLPFI